MRKKRKKTSIIWTIPRAELEQLVKNVDSLGAVLKNFDLINKGGNSRTLKTRLLYEGIDFSHITMGIASNKGRTFPNKAQPIEEIMIENSTASRGNIKRRIISSQIIPHQCAKCGIGLEWIGNPLVLVLDHINGICNDHRKENLRFLCPNCNSQTSTFCGKNNKTKNICSKCGKHRSGCSEFCSSCSKPMPRPNRRKVERPSKETLHKMLWEIPTMKIAEQFGVCDKAVEKWAKSYNISKPPRGYWAKQKSQNEHTRNMAGTNGVGRT